VQVRTLAKPQPAASDTAPPAPALAAGTGT
jgi:hypothetical protein